MREHDIRVAHALGWTQPTRRTWRLRLYYRFITGTSFSDLPAGAEDEVRRLYRTVKWWHRSEAWKGLSR